MGIAGLIKMSHLNPEQQEVAELIGINNYRNLVDIFGGSAIWIPKARSLVSAEEIKEYIIIRRKNSCSVEQISHELEMPFSEVRKMLK